MPYVYMGQALGKQQPFVCVWNLSHGQPLGEKSSPKQRALGRGRTGVFRSIRHTPKNLEILLENMVFPQEAGFGNTLGKGFENTLGKGLCFPVCPHPSLAASFAYSSPRHGVLCLCVSSHST